jgi:predicted PurR-regulated permease PerM
MDESPIEQRDSLSIEPKETLPRDSFVSRNMNKIMNKIKSIAKSLASDMTSLSISIYFGSFITLYLFVGFYSGCFAKNGYKLCNLLLPWYFPLEKPTNPPNPIFDD